MAVEPVYLPTLGMGALLTLACAVGWLFNHTTEIAGSWREGRDQVAVWTAAAVTWALLVLSEVALWVLLHTAARKGGA